jgi:vanillate O-demethylase monooxygenase subunit
LNCWYVAAAPGELAPGPLARRICGMDVVLFRTTDGAVAALEDRCSHRLAPLSRGCVVGERLRCGYHGAEFDAAGRCVAVPGQAEIPPRAEVRSFPVCERHGFIWIWTGEPALARSTPPCDLFAYIGVGRWGMRDGRMPIACNYLLVNDNLADVSHTEFVHATTLGTPNARATRQDGVPVAEQGRNTFEAQVSDLGIDFRIRFRNTRLALAFETAYARVHGRGDWDGLDFQLDYMFRPPSFWIFRPITMRCGAPPEEGVRFDGLIAVTPETFTSCHYFHKSCQNYAPDDPLETDFWHEQTSIAFREDKVILEAQQERLAGRALRDVHHVSFQGDRLGFVARRMVAERVAAETGAEAAA